MILAGDIGGTKTNLAYFQIAEGRLRVVRDFSYPSQEFDSLEEVVEKFRSAFPTEITAAAFGVAGPVVDGRTEATNLSWIVDSRSLAAMLGLEQVGLINDLQATAYGILQLGDEDILVLIRVYRKSMQPSGLLLSVQDWVKVRLCGMGRGTMRLLLKADTRTSLPAMKPKSRCYAF